MKPTADKLLELLATRHAGDVFVPQCKNGPTQSRGAGLRIMDAWVMKRSWTQSLTVGYEIKASRSDFLKDVKWRDYLPYCARFYFVTPSKVVDPAELPDEAGLLVASTNFTRLYTKKQAPWRDVEIPEVLWRYILICRAKITRERCTDNRREWQQWLADRKVDRALGRMVSRSLRKTVEQQILRAQTENAELRRQIESMREVQDMLKRIGLEPSYCPVRVVETHLQGQLPRDLRFTAVRLRTQLAELVKTIDKLQDQCPKSLS